MVVHNLVPTRSGSTLPGLLEPRNAEFPAANFASLLRTPGNLVLAFDDHSVEEARWTCEIVEEIDLLLLTIHWRPAVDGGTGFPLFQTRLTWQRPSGPWLLDALRFAPTERSDRHRAVLHLPAWKPPIGEIGVLSLHRLASHPDDTLQGDAFVTLVQAIRLAIGIAGEDVPL